MPTGTKKNKVNRNKTLKNIQNLASDKAWFRILATKKEFPGQKIQLYHTNLKENFPGQLLKEFDPKEYVKQKQKLYVQKHLNTRKSNSRPKRGPGSRGVTSFIRKKNESFENFVKRITVGL